jgi:hypothetical protein
MPCLSAACFIISKEVLSKAPSMSRNAPRAISPVTGIALPYLLSDDGYVWPKCDEIYMKQE